MKNGIRIDPSRSGAFTTRVLIGVATLGAVLLLVRAIPALFRTLRARRT